MFRGKRLHETLEKAIQVVKTQVVAISPTVTWDSIVGKPTIPVAQRGGAMFVSATDPALTETVEDYDIWYKLL